VSKFRHQLKLFRLIPHLYTRKQPELLNFVAETLLDIAMMHSDTLIARAREGIRMPKANWCSSGTSASTTLATNSFSIMTWQWKCSEDFYKHAQESRKSARSNSFQVVAVHYRGELLPRRNEKEKSEQITFTA